MKPAVLVLASMIVASCASAPDADRPDGAKPGTGPPLSQTMCPVMEGERINERLYVDYKGFRIYVCCGPCVKAVKKNPEKYLRKLEEQGVRLEKAEQAGTADDMEKADMP